MQHQKTKLIQPPTPIMTIQATPGEIIVLQAALHHYQQSLSPELYQQATPLIQNVIRRLHDQLPPRKEQRETQ